MFYKTVKRKILHPEHSGHPHSVLMDKNISESFDQQIGGVISIDVVYMLYLMI